MQLSKKKTCLLESSSMIWTRTVPSWRHGPVPVAVVSLRAVLRTVPGMNFLMSLQMWPVEELSQTKNIESVLNGTCVLSVPRSASA